eukprot:PhM_4_TR4136/c0_g1_i1/m.69882
MSSIYDRVKQRAMERENRLKSEEEAEMQWGQGALLAVRDADAGLVMVVRVQENVDSGTVSSNSTFKATLFNFNPKLHEYRETGNVVDVKPSNVLRPVQLTSARTLPEKTVKWLLEHCPKTADVDSTSNSSDAGDEHVSGGEEEEGGDDNDGEPPAKKAKGKKAAPKAKKAAPKAKKSGPKKSKRGDSDREGSDADSDAGAKPKGKKASAKKASAKKSAKAKTVHYPFEDRTDELHAPSNDLDPNSHKEALRAALTDNAVLFEKVLASKHHEMWLTHDTNAAEEFGVAKDSTPLHIILKRRHPDMIKVIAKNAERFGLVAEHFDTDANNNYNPVESDSVAKPVDLPSIFAGVNTEDDDDDGWNKPPKILSETMPNTFERWGEGVATPNESMMQRTSTGHNSGQSYGFRGRARAVKAGRGGRELNDAFTSSLECIALASVPTLLQTMLSNGDVTMAELKQLCAHFPAKYHNSLMLNHSHNVSQYLGAIPTLSKIGDNEAAAEVMKPFLEKQGFPVSQLQYIALCGTTATELPPKTLRANILKMGVQNATAVHYACINPSAEILKAFLAIDSTLGQEVRDGAQLQPVHYASASKTPEALKALLAQYPTLHLLAPSSFHGSPARIAVALGRADNLAVLLQRDAEQQIAPTSKMDCNLFLHAVKSGHVDVVKAIVKAIKDDAAQKKLIRSTVPQRGLTGLHVAALRGDLDMLKYLLSLKVPIDSKDRMKRTPFLLAAKAGHHHVVTYLASAGANVGIADSSGNMAVHYAAAYGHLSILRYAVEKCEQDPNTQTAWKMTPLSLSLMKGYGSTCGRYLLNHCRERVDINFRDNEYRTILFQLWKAEADEQSYGTVPELIDKFKFLFVNGADPSLALGDGTTMMHKLAASTVGSMRKDVLSAWLEALNKRLEELKKAANAPKTQVVSATDKLLEVLNAAPAAAAAADEDVDDEDGDEDDDDEHNDDDDEGGNENSDEEHNDDDDDDDDENSDDEDDDDDDEDDDDDDCDSDSSDCAPRSPKAAHRRRRNINIHSIFNKRYTTLHNHMITMASIEKEIARVEKELTFPEVEVQVATLILNAPAVTSDEARVKLVNARDTNGSTPLIVAANRGNYAMVGFLLKHGADVQITDSRGFTILHMLCAALSTEQIKLLDRAVVAEMLKSVDVNGMSPALRVMEYFYKSHGGTDLKDRPEFVASVTQLLKLLHSVSGDILYDQVQPFKPTALADGEKRTNSNPKAPPMAISCVAPKLQLKGINELDNPLQDADERVQTPDLPLTLDNTYHWYGGASLLHFAVAAGSAEMVKELINAEAVGDKKLAYAKDAWGRTVLHYCVCLGNDVMTTTLLSSVDDAEALIAQSIDCNGDTLMHLATRLNSEKLVDLLLESKNKKSLVCAANKAGIVPLHEAAFFRHTTKMNKLIEAGADVTAVSGTGRTVIMYSLANMNPAVFHLFETERQLIDAGANPNAVDKIGRTALHYCFTALDTTDVRMDNDPIEAVTSLLIRMDPALVDRRDGFGLAAISYAVLSRSLSCSLALTSKGKCDINIQDNNGNSPLALSMLGGSSGLAITLLQCNGIRPDTSITKVIRRKPTKVVETDSSIVYSMKSQWHGLTHVLLERGFPVREAIHGGVLTSHVALCLNIIDKIPAADRQTKLSGPVTGAKGWTLLHTALSKHEQLDAKLKLLDYLFDDVKLVLSAVDEAGKRPQHHMAPFHQILSQPPTVMSEALLAYLSRRGIDWNASHGASRFTLASNLFPVAPSPLSDGARNTLTTILTKYGASGDFDVVMKLPNSRTAATTTSLIWCLYANDYKTLHCLLSAGCSMTRADDNKWTALHHAVSLRNQAMVSVFLTRSSSDLVNMQDTQGMTPLHHAVLNNDTESVKLLLGAESIDPNVQESLFGGFTALHVAVQPMDYASFENCDIVRALLAHPKIDVFTKSNAGYTAMEMTTIQSSGTLKKVFEDCNVVVPALSRISSIIPTTQWTATHRFIDVEANAKAYVQKVHAKREEVPLTAAQRVDPVYHKMHSNATVDVAQVHEEYDAVLTKVDISYGEWGMNVFYRLQLVYDTMRQVYVLWTRWGRVGEDGQYQATPFAQAPEAVAEFRRIFKAKTSNDWGVDFVKIPKKYLFHEPATVRVKAEELLKPFSHSQLEACKSKMPVALYDAVKELTDITRMTQEYKRTSVEAEAFPLGSIKPEAMAAGLKLLNEMREALTIREEGSHQVSQEARDKVVELTNEYYALIPRAGTDYTQLTPPSRVDDVAKMWHKLETMQQLERAARFIMSAHHVLSSPETMENPMDHIFDALNVDAAVVRPDLDKGEFSILRLYIANSVQYRVHNIFRIQRKGEAEKFQSQFGHIANRRLLFHGSGSQNILTILADGLRIAPPEAPVAGYMFGKGIYFADIASKSLSYTRDTPTAERSVFMFLCEVAVGNAHEPTGAHFFSSPPAGFDSVKGVGQTVPNPAQDVVLNNGVIVPLGAPGSYTTATPEAQSKYRNHSLLSHNEFIVYNPDQVRLRYLVQFKELKRA